MANAYAGSHRRYNDQSAYSFGRKRTQDLVETLQSKVLTLVRVSTFVLSNRTEAVEQLPAPTYAELLGSAAEQYTHRGSG